MSGSDKVSLPDGRGQDGNLPGGGDGKDDHRGQDTVAVNRPPLFTPGQTVVLMCALAAWIFFMFVAYVLPEPLPPAPIEIQTEPGPAPSMPPIEWTPA